MDKDKIVRLAELFKALSNLNRLAIFEAIRDMSCSGPAGCDMDEKSCVRAIGKSFTIAPSTLSEHLKELKRAGLIDMVKQGRMVHCSIAPKALADLEGFIAKRRR
jgi:ArsR family transcriptional regulator